MPTRSVYPRYSHPSVSSSRFASFSNTRPEHTFFEPGSRLSDGSSGASFSPPHHSTSSPRLVCPFNTRSQHNPVQLGRGFSDGCCGVFAPQPFSQSSLSSDSPCVVTAVRISPAFTKPHSTTIDLHQAPPCTTIMNRKSISSSYNPSSRLVSSQAIRSSQIPHQFLRFLAEKNFHSCVQPFQHQTFLSIPLLANALYQRALAPQHRPVKLPCPFLASMRVPIAALDVRSPCNQQSVRLTGSKRKSRHIGPPTALEQTHNARRFFSQSSRGGRFACTSTGYASDQLAQSRSHSLSLTRRA